MSLLGADPVDLEAGDAALLGGQVDTTVHLQTHAGDIARVQGDVLHLLAPVVGEEVLERQLDDAELLLGHLRTGKGARPS